TWCLKWHGHQTVPQRGALTLHSVSAGLALAIEVEPLFVVLLVVGTELQCLLLPFNGLLEISTLGVGGNVSRISKSFHFVKSQALVASSTDLLPFRQPSAVHVANSQPRPLRAPTLFGSSLIMRSKSAMALANSFLAA